MKYLLVFLCIGGIIIFSGCSGEEEPVARENSDVIFFTTQDLGCGNINVSFNNGAPKSITTFFPSGVVRCEDNIQARFSNVPFGTYEYEAISAIGCLWRGTVNVTANNPCASVELSTSNLTGNICSEDMWNKNESCLEVIAVRDEEGGCGALGGAPTYFIEIVNNCMTEQNVNVCAVAFTGVNDIVAPGDTLVLSSCDSFEGADIYSVSTALINTYKCEDVAMSFRCPG